MTVSAAGSYTVVITNLEGCSSIPSKAVAFYVTGVEDLNANVLLYPNPSSDQVTLRLNRFEKNESINLSIYNILGSLIEKRVVNSDQDVYMDIHGYAHGQYILVLQSGNRIIKKQFIKK